MTGLCSLLTGETNLTLYNSCVFYRLSQVILAGHSQHECIQEKDSLLSVINTEKDQLAKELASANDLMSSLQAELEGLYNTLAVSKVKWLKLSPCFIFVIIQEESTSLEVELEQLISQVSYARADAWCS